MAIEQVEPNKKTGEWIDPNLIPLTLHEAIDGFDLHPQPPHPCAEDRVERHSAAKRAPERFLEKPELIVISEPYWTAAAKHADIVLPITTSFERNDLTMTYATCLLYGICTKKGLI